MIEKRDKSNKIKNYIIVFLCVLAAGGLFLYLIGWDNPYNSYALQAERWLSGHLDLGRNYSHLEIAAFEGKFYVSFPPFPSVVLLPFVLLFGTATPDHVICLAATLLGAFYAVKIAEKYGKGAFYVLFLLLASNYLLVAYCGWVWFMAQCFCFVLSLMAIYYAIDDVPSHGALSLAFWALSVGCRPMQAVYLPLLLYLIYKKTGKNIKKYWYFAIAPCVIAAAFMALNYFRFGSVTEFGHNFLPEFLADPQFSPAYILQNVKNLFRLPLENGKISFPAFNGFAFYLVSPMFLSFACYGLRNVIWHKKGADKAVSIGVPILIAVHFLLLASHRTMGGWQWGNRYTIDALPYLFLAFLEVSRHRGWMRYLDYILFIFGITLNFYGTVLFFTGGI